MFYFHCNPEFHLNKKYLEISFVDKSVFSVFMEELEKFG